MILVLGFNLESPSLGNTASIIIPEIFLDLPNP
jgi:hypothetical protein